MIDTEKLLRLMRNQRSDFITICQAADRIESLQAENEQLRQATPPVDPMRRAVADALNRAGIRQIDPHREPAHYEQDFSAFITCLLALGVTVTPPVNPATIFTHLWDAEGDKIPVEFVSGPDKRGIYRWLVLGTHRVTKGGRFGGDGQYCLSHADGTCPQYPAIHLIRKDTE